MKSLLLLLLLMVCIIARGQQDTTCIKCDTLEKHSTAIGYLSKAARNVVFDPKNVGGGQLALGIHAEAASWRAQAFGDYAIAGSTSSTAVGYGAVCIMIHGVAIGRGAYMPLLDQTVYNNLPNTHAPVVVGGTGTDLGVGNWWGHKFRKMPSGTSVSDIVPSTVTLFYHGQDAYDDTTNEVNIAGGHIGLAAGRGTGTGKGGEIRFYTAPAKNLSGGKKNALVLTGKVTVNGYVPHKVTNLQMLALTNVEEGTLVHNTTLHVPCWFNGTDWECMNGAAPITKR